MINNLLAGLGLDDGLFPSPLSAQPVSYLLTHLDSGSLSGLPPSEVKTYTLSSISGFIYLNQKPKKPKEKRKHSES